MNIRNLQRTGQFGGRVEFPENHIRTVLPNAVRGDFRAMSAFGWAQPPSTEEDDSFTADTRHLPAEQRLFTEKRPAALLGSLLIFDTMKLHSIASTLNQDGRMTAAGRLERFAEHRTTGIRSISTHEATLRGLEAENALAAATHFAAPRIASGDVSGASEDREVRDYWRTLDAPGRLQLLNQTTGRMRERLLEALQRSPLQLDTVPEVVRQVDEGWREVVRQRDPEGTAQILDTQAHTQWARDVADASRTYMADLLGEKIDTYQAIRDIVGAPAFWGLADYTKGFEARLQSRAA